MTFYVDSHFPVAEQFRWHSAYALWVVAAVQSLHRLRLSVTPHACSAPGLPVLHHLLEFAQSHVH